MLLPVTGSSGGKRKKTVVKTVKARPVYTSSVWLLVLDDGTYDVANWSQDGAERQCGFGQRWRSQNLSTPDDNEQDYHDQCNERTRITHKSEVIRTWDRVRDVQKHNRTRQDGV